MVFVEFVLVVVGLVEEGRCALYIGEGDASGSGRGHTVLSRGCCLLGPGVREKEPCAVSDKTRPPFQKQLPLLFGDLSERCSLGHTKS